MKISTTNVKKIHAMTPPGEKCSLKFTHWSSINDMITKPVISRPIGTHKKNCIIERYFFKIALSKRYIVPILPFGPGYAP